MCHHCPKPKPTKDRNKVDIALDIVAYLALFLVLFAVFGEILLGFAR